MNSTPDPLSFIEEKNILTKKETEKKREYKTVKTPENNKNYYSVFSHKKCDVCHSRDIFNRDHTGGPSTCESCRVKRTLITSKNFHFSNSYDDVAISKKDIDLLHLPDRHRLFRLLWKMGKIKRIRDANG